MIEMHTLTPARGSRTRVKRIGRGNASGKGTTAGKGTKGQRARTGGRNKLKLKGMRQMLLSFPKKRGFTSSIPQPVAITLEQLAVFTKPMTVDINALKKAGLIPKNRQMAKIIVKGEAPKVALVFIDIAATAGAKQAIEKAGGSFKVKEPVKRKGKASSS